MNDNLEKDKKNNLREEFSIVKFNLIKNELQSNGIEISSNIKTISELKEFVKKNYSDIIYKNVLDKIDKISSNLDNLITGLSEKEGNSFINKLEKIVVPLSKIAALGLASRSAVLLAPTVESKLVVTGAIMANSIYKLVKSKKAGIVVSQESECNLILQELEVTKNSSGLVIDTRFPKEIQEEIRNFLITHKVNFINTGYLSLREAIYNLDFDSKRELCNIINNRLGRGISVEERIKSKKSSFFKSFGKNSAMIGGSTASGVGIATAVNSVDPAIIAAPLNATALGLVIHEYTQNPVLAGILGLTGGTGSAFLGYVPIAGEVFENALAVENMIACGTLGAGLGISSVIISNIVKTIKNAGNKFSNMRNRKEILSYDAELYKADNEEEIKTMQKLVKQNNSLEEQIVFDFLYQYMSEELKITFQQNPTTLADLKKCIANCSPDEKRKISHFSEKLKEINNGHSDFMNMLINIKKNVTMALTFGLASLSIYDILKDGTVIPEISSKIFKNVPDNIYLMIPEKPMIDSIDSNGKIINRSEELGMIEDLEKTKSTYAELETMLKETTFIGEKASDISQDIISSSNDVANGSFLEGVKEFFNDPVDKIGDVLDSIGDFAKETIDNIRNSDKSFSDVVDYFTETKYVPDTEKIIAKINSLSKEELVDLAYYYNLSPEVEMNVDIYKAIGNALQQKIGVIQTGIDEYNKAMEAIKITSRAAEATAVGSEVVGNVKKYIR